MNFWKWCGSPAEEENIEQRKPRNKELQKIQKMKCFVFEDGSFITLEGLKKSLLNGYELAMTYSDYLDGEVDNGYCYYDLTIYFSKEMNIILSFEIPSNVWEKNDIDDIILPFEVCKITSHQSQINGIEFKQSQKVLLDSFLSHMTPKDIKLKLLPSYGEVEFLELVG